MLELDQSERYELDEALERLSNKTCDEAIELLTDEQVKEIVRRIILKRKKKLLEIYA